MTPNETKRVEKVYLWVTQILFFFFFLAFCTVHNDTSLYQEIDLSSHTVIPRVKRMARKKENIKLVAKERPHCFKLIGQEQHKYNTTQHQ